MYLIEALYIPKLPTCSFLEQTPLRFAVCFFFYVFFFFLGGGGGGAKTEAHP